MSDAQQRIERWQQTQVRVAQWATDLLAAADEAQADRDAADAALAAFGAASNADKIAMIQAILQRQRRSAGRERLVARRAARLAMLVSRGSRPIDLSDLAD